MTNCPLIPAHLAAAVAEREALRLRFPAPNLTDAASAAGTLQNVPKTPAVGAQDERMPDPLCRDSATREEVGVSGAKNGKAKKPKKPKREKSYRPPFGGSRSQTVEEFDRIHWRWADTLAEKLPEGVPQEPGMWRCRTCHSAVEQQNGGPWRHVLPELSTHKHWTRKGDVYVGPHEPEPYFDERLWPSTWGEYDEATETAHHSADAGRADSCFQCGFCQYYLTLDSRLGADWGACSNPRSEYDGRVTFEHWTCRHFRA